MRSKLADFEVVDHADVDDADPTQTYYRHSETLLRFNLDSQSTSGLDDDDEKYAKRVRAAHQYACDQSEAKSQGMPIGAYIKSKPATKAAAKTSLAERAAAKAQTDPGIIRDHERLEQLKQATQKKLDEQDHRNEQKAVALATSNLKILGRHQRQEVRLEAAEKFAEAEVEFAQFAGAAVHELDQETAKRSEHEDEEAFGGEEYSSSEHGDELSDASPPTPFVRPALEAAGNSPSIGVPIAQSTTIEPLYPYASVGVDPCPPVVLPASLATRVVPARARSLVEASPALRAEPAISSEPARSSSSPAAMVIAEQPLVSSLKARNTELEAKVVEEQTKSARRYVCLKQTMTKLTEAQAQLCEEKQLRAKAEETVEAMQQTITQAEKHADDVEARLYESESREDNSEKTIKDMQQTIKNLTDQKTSLKLLAEKLQSQIDEEQEKTKAAQAKLRVQINAPPQATPSPRKAEQVGTLVGTGPTPRR